MANSSFFHTKAGKMTLAFIVIMVAFVLIMLGLTYENRLLGYIGFSAMLLAMIYSPLDVYIINRKKH